MRRRRSSHHSETSALAQIFSLAAKVSFGVALGLMVTEGVTGFALKKIREYRPVYSLSYSDEEISKLYDAVEPARYREVIDEGRRLADLVYSPLVEHRMVPAAGTHFNIAEDGFRSNGKPQSLTAPGPKVFVFGGSTLLGMGVADDETIPAYLQEALSVGGKQAQVFNFGAQSYYSTQERIALERMLTAGTKPDVAVFVDGLGDFDTCQTPDQTAWNERLTQVTRARARMPLTAELAGRSNILQLARWMSGDRSVGVREWGSFCVSAADVDSAVTRLDTNRRMISAMAERLGFKAVFVQQPVPTYNYDNAKRPVPLTADMLGFHVNSGKGYPRMAEMKAAGQLWDKDLLWLAALEPAEGNAYVDTVHYSPRFNRTIAEAIARHMLDGNLLP